MRTATKAFLESLEEKARARRDAILNSEDTVSVSGTCRYVSAVGDDLQDGLSPETAWRTLERVNAEELEYGDAVLFRRGDVFRGQLFCVSGVTYAAYGRGEKPRLYGWEKDLADPRLWEIADESAHIYRMTEPILDCGTLVFDGGKRHSYKHIPSWFGGKFTVRDEPEKDFVISEQLTGDLDIFCDCRAVMTERPSRGESFPVPEMGAKNTGTLYLRCEAGNPGEVFDSIEALPGRNTVCVGMNADVHIDNLCIRYCGAHAIGAGGDCVKGLTVTNCEIGWVGGTIQHYFGTDPNYPEGTRGTVTRFGNGVEIYGGCEDFLCANNWIYQVYDAGATHQYTVTAKKKSCVMRNVRYTGNLIERCVYSIEYFLSRTEGTQSRMEDILIDDNILRFSGSGWGQQRHNTWTGAHIKGWTEDNPAVRYTIRDNVFDRAEYRMLHLCARDEASLPRMRNNTYIQKLGHGFAQYGAFRDGVPCVTAFSEITDAEKELGDIGAEVCAIK